ncbi:hypothetical protein D9756_004503 [Leucocoprinus leucothites]|uniref:Uncharacterized protein n=1 Tax=Leucocoprinus leucothites TaxID=201217 RepID=A0A8H5LKK5_9AGAR|nr:hypothetical protein D9756_004503 [Leucoagaricus leucothites]
MPHKRAKRSAREEQRKQEGSNHAPRKESISNEAIPKSVARVLNASKIREAYKKKRKWEQAGDDDKDKRKRQKTEDFQLKIKPGESIQHFYRRVEDDMRPMVRSAVQTSKAVERKARNAELVSGKKGKTFASLPEPSRSATGHKSRGQSPPPPSGLEPKGPKNDNNTERPKEFAELSTSAPRRLNDIAHAPPEFKKTPRGAKHAGTGAKREGILSMAQKSMMEQEREKAIARYRMLKASRLPPTERE